MNAIYKFVLGLIGKRSGVITTLPNKKQIEFQANMLAEKFMQNGIDPNALKSPEQVKNVLANIDQSNMRVIPADSSEGRGITKALGIGKEADVMDMKGNKINTSKGIMGGEEIKTSTSDADMIIKNIKSMKPMEAMKEANFVIGRKGKYKNLTEDQSKKILKDTEDHIFERDIPKDPEDFAIGGRVGLKGGAFLNFIKNLGKGMNNKSPLQFGKDYLKNVKDKTLKANETGKFMDLPIPEVGIPAATGALVNNQIRKKLKAMNEEQKEENLKIFIRELENDKFYDKYPDLKDKMIADYTESLFGVKKADGGRIGLKGGGADASKSDFKTSSTQTTNREKGIMSQYQGPKGTTGNINNNNNNDDGPKGPPIITNPPPKDNKPPETITFDNITGKKMTAADRLAKQKFIDFINSKKVYSSGENEEADELYDAYRTATGLDDFQTNALVNSTTNQLVNQIDGNTKTFYDRNSTITDLDTGKSTKQLVVETPTSFTQRVVRPSGIMENDIPQPFGDPQSLSVDPYSKFADGGRIGYKAGSVDKMRRLILKAIGAGTAGIATAKSGIFSLGKGATKQAAKEVVQKSTTTPPPYFFKLAEKIKMLGDNATATSDRTIAKTLKSKDGKSTYLLEEDVTSGDTIIKKINKEGDEMITDVELMEFSKGEVVMGKNGKPVKTPDNYEEVTEANARIEGDVFNDPYYTDGIQVDDIIKEVDDTTPSIKYATGGRVPYFKGGLAALKSLMNYFAKEKGVTGSKLLSDINPKKLDSGIKNLMSKEELDILKENRTEYLKHLLNIMKSDKKFLDNNRELVEEAIAQAPIGLKEFAKEMSDSIKRNAMKENRLERLSVYDKVNPDDAIMDVEMMIKNMSTGKDKRALNATGGVARLLGE